ncbi:MAG TPA: hypothetical protein VNL91_05505 [Thermoanaerobaculia bacterium]|nr:hypothetical protein [Thermoanaerobaculia bacterium]
MTDHGESHSAREQRRLGRLAVDIAATHSGPWQTIAALTRKHPASAVAIALLAGMILAAVIRKR